MKIKMFKEHSKSVSSLELLFDNWPMISMKSNVKRKFFISIGSFYVFFTIGGGLDKLQIYTYITTLKFCNEVFIGKIEKSEIIKKKGAINFTI